MALRHIRTFGRQCSTISSRRAYTTFSGYGQHRTSMAMPPSTTTMQHGIQAMLMWISLVVISMALLLLRTSRSIMKSLLAILIRLLLWQSVETVMEMNLRKSPIYGTPERSGRGSVLGMVAICLLTHGGKMLCRRSLSSREMR